MKKLFEKLNKLGYTFTNKRVLGNPDHTSLETREKDLTQEYALIVMWLLDKYRIWIEVCFHKEEATFQWKINGELGRFQEITPGRAYLAAIEYTLKNLL